MNTLESGSTSTSREKHPTNSVRDSRNNFRCESHEEFKIGDKVFIRKELLHISPVWKKYSYFTVAEIAQPIKEDIPRHPQLLTLNNPNGKKVTSKGGSNHIPREILGNLVTKNSTKKVATRATT